MNGWKARKVNGREVIGLKKRDINKDILLLFLVCYEYGLSFTYVMKLYAVSKKYFWTFLEVFSPMLKMGIRKATNLRRSVDKILDCMNNSASVDNLTPTEERMMEVFSWYIEDNFTDGEGCIHVSQFDGLPFAKAYGEHDLYIPNRTKLLSENVDRIEYIEMGNEKFYKTSKILYFMERYSGDTDIRELDSLSVQEMIRRIQDGVDKINEKERRELNIPSEQWV